MCRTILRWAPWMTGCSVPQPSRRQLAFSSSLSTYKASSLLRLPRLHQLLSPYAQFHSAEQTMDSIPADREHHPHPTPFLCHVSALTCTQVLILTLTRAGDGFIAIGWNVSCATLHLTLTRFAGGLSNCVLELLLSRLMTKKKGVSTGSSSSPPTTHNVLWRGCPLR